MSIHRLNNQAILVQSRSKGAAHLYAPHLLLKKGEESAALPQEKETSAHRQG